MTVTPAPLPAGSGTAASGTGASRTGGPAAASPAVLSSTAAAPFSKAELATLAPSAGADGLNGLELGRLAAAGGAYRRAASLG